MSKFLDRYTNDKKKASDSDYSVDFSGEWSTVQNVVDLLSRTKVGKDVIQPGSLTIFTQEGRLFACLNDKHHKEIGFMELSKHSINVIAQIEEGIESDSIRWREQRGTRVPSDTPF